MVDFSLIPNEKLRLLALASPSIATLDDIGKQEMAAKFQEANSEDQMFYISTLEKEQQDIKETDKLWSQDIAKAADKVNEAMQDLVHIEYEVRKTEESHDQEEENKHAEEILHQLRSL